MVLFCEATEKEWRVAKSLKDAIAVAEKESDRQLKAGAEIIESCHRKADYYLDVFDNGVVVEYYFDI